VGRITSKKTDRLSRFHGRKAVMQGSLVLSLLFHVTVLLAVQKIVPINLFTQPLRTYHVELFRPPVDPLEEEISSSTDLSKIKAEEEKEPEETEETISLDTRDERYSTYAKVIKEQLMREWHYPQEAFEDLIEGDVLVLFSLNRKGKLLQVKVLQPSPFPILEKETIRTVQSAAPYPVFPGSVKVTKLHIKANFTYRIAARR
jgi:TonB family protein